ncbi:hypothetical protein FN846DRAFT_901781 [Sphaerosporella brunnea]|uniref:F-box domain-containing protein n=1 Tax=Sphaerosporella brunnea TaxID=1250544 RepID=A0A5J5FBI5_9PEZI|nr:hypothetical protein FN846DRAFT_901781 [Sphaerosporella brunnea]
MATLCSIPSELHIEILSKLPDLRSLAAAIFTSRAIYKAFIIARHDVMQRVLDAEIPLASIIGEIDCLLPPHCVAALKQQWTVIQRTESSLALLDLPVLYALLFEPQTASCTFETYLGSELSWHRSWVDLFTADRTNRTHNSNAFPPRCLCTRRDISSEEYDACLRGTAEDVGSILAVECLEQAVRYDLALWDDSRLARLGFFVPVL